MMKSSLVLTFIAAAVSLSFTDPNKVAVDQKVQQVFEATRQIESLKYDFVRTERINGKFESNESSVKMTRRPYQVYMKLQEPQAGIEVLYPHPTDEKRALVNPNGFPWVNLKLDPKGDLMRKGQHHTILDCGYDHVVSVMEYLFYKHKNEINQILNEHGTARVNGRNCEVISMVNSDFGYLNHEVKKGESIASIALKNRLNEYLIYEKNNQLGLFAGVKEGDIIKVPTDYAAKMYLYIDIEKQIPLKLEIYDELGLFEKYEFKNVEINPELSAEEFSHGNTAYQF
ncbi:MAG: DUF1571 domain-containing protein [Reichenbachiella sp.]|uniref:DUF1571 domain-containing protein n=1 Tax=Reichenbachiella sp. TaxID=2184521 RepID=UPI003263A193